MIVRAMDLFDAFSRGALSFDRACIVSAFFTPDSSYARYEIVAYGGLASVFPGEEGLCFVAEGRKLLVLVEPADYERRGSEPFLRPSGELIGLRLDELELHAAGNGSRAYLGSLPLRGSFTIARPTGLDFAFCFFALPDLSETLRLFFEKTLCREARLPASDAMELAASVAAKAEAAMEELGRRV
jgi:hypothetical protein